MSVPSWPRLSRIPLRSASSSTSICLGSMATSLAASRIGRSPRSCTARTFERALSVVRRDDLGDAPFGGFLHRVAASAVIDHARRQARSIPAGVRASDLDEDGDREAAETISDEAAMRVFTAAVDRDVLRRALQALSRAPRQGDHAPVFRWARSGRARRRPRVNALSVRREAAPSPPGAPRGDVPRGERCGLTTGDCSRTRCRRPQRAARRRPGATRRRAGGSWRSGPSGPAWSRPADAARYEIAASAGGFSPRFRPRSRCGPDPRRDRERPHSPLNRGGASR